jgi:hypothetical protein
MTWSMGKAEFFFTMVVWGVFVCCWTIIGAVAYQERKQRKPTAPPEKSKFKEESLERLIMDKLAQLIKEARDEAEHEFKWKNSWRELCDTAASEGFRGGWDARGTYEAKRTDPLVAAIRQLGLMCVNTGMYGPMNLRPGECTCSTCNMKKALEKYDSGE